jgi:hypothetical protein
MSFVIVGPDFVDLMPSEYDHNWPKHVKAINIYKLNGKVQVWDRFHLHNFHTNFNQSSPNGSQVVPHLKIQASVMLILPTAGNQKV